MKPISLPNSPEVNKELKSTKSEDLSKLKDLRFKVHRELEILDSLIENVAIRSVCGDSNEAQHVERYDGTLGVTQDFVKKLSPSIGQLQWSPFIYRDFRGPSRSQGNVQGLSWGSGALISSDLFLTAGHCFHQTMGIWTRPSENGSVLPETELAKLMQVNFNYQFAKHTNTILPVDTFPVLELVDYQIEPIDFAIVRLGKNSKGESPGDKYPKLSLALSNFVSPGEMLCVIQHPKGSPKKIEAGPLHSTDGIRLYYDSIDTLGASSGAPILWAETEKIVGVHTNGGCTLNSGYNYGNSIQAIAKVTSHF
ncbi:trypsin-like serine peptidase [Roseivirga echinicomitans]|uniref:Serine protease n=1 Tax=Roseivirga echinicomitans TaxID=296218 RepID=A0A150X243_9BACT|nr:serine protease [Roseivirga echinicomitans]KYG72787.1 hypothetical protein AWN68_08780 [Roseivirga echinicomitans]